MNILTHVDQLQLNLFVKSLTGERLHIKFGNLSFTRSQNVSHRYIMGKRCYGTMAIIFDSTFILPAGNKGSHQVLEKIYFRAGLAIPFGVTSHSVTKIFP